MLTGLCAGFGEPLPELDWQLIYGLGLCGIRQDIPNVQAAAPLVVDMAGRGAVQSIALANVRGLGTVELAESIAVSIKATGQTDRVALKLGNEEDINGCWGFDPVGYGQLVARIVDMRDMVLPGLRVVTAGISSTSHDALAWLAAAMPYIPHSVTVGVHTYRSTPPGLPLKGYASRSAEFAALRAIAGDRPLWNTEIGWHSAPRQRDFPLCWTSWRYSDGEIAAFLREEMRINAQFGVEAAFIFQLNDSKRDEPEGRFGIRDVNGKLKPSAQVAKEWRA